MEIKMITGCTANYLGIDGKSEVDMTDEQRLSAWKYITKAEKEANSLRTSSLTPAVLQQMWIDKWNGEVPTVITNGNSSTFIDLSKIGK